MLEEREKNIYEAAIKVLSKTLSSGNEKAKEIQAKLYTLANTLIRIETTLMAVADRLKMSANGQSEEFEAWKHDMRAKVYGGCAASVLMGPGAVAICYSVGAGVLETEINEYKAEVTRFEAEFTSWSETFTVLATMAGQAKDVSMNWYEKLTDFRNIIQNQYDLISGTEDVLWMSQEMRTMVTNSLDELVEQCDIIINDTTGKLEETH